MFMMYNSPTFETFTTVQYFGSLCNIMGLKICFFNMWLSTLTHTSAHKVTFVG